MKRDSVSFLKHRWWYFLLMAPTIPYGGQAAIEGVLMKGIDHASLAMRRMNGQIEVIDRKVKSNFPKLTKLPFVRGFFVLWDMMFLGMWAISQSSKRFEEDLEEKEREKLKAEGKEEEAAKLSEKSNGEISPLARNLLMLGSLALALFIFKVLPAMAATGVFTLFGWGALSDIPDPTFIQQLLANAVEGLVKLSIFITYIWSVGRISEIARVFQYHGAEHIVINAYEADSDNQDMEFIESHTTAHPRCGTSFIVILILLSILLFTLLDWIIVANWPQLVANGMPVNYLRWPLRILALPMLAGLSYEVIKAAFKYYGSPVITPLLKFGMLFQQLTTRRPTKEQIEVSLVSFNRVRYLTEDIAEPNTEKRTLVDSI